MKRNPFRPSFGSIPAALAGRSELIREIMDGLDNGVGDPNRATIFVGARGTGKTVLLATIAERIQGRGWISVNVTSGNGMLKEILVQSREKTAHILASSTQSKLSGLQIGPLAVTMELDKAVSTWRSEMAVLIEELNQKDIGLLITIDEISPHHEELHVLVDTFQHFVRERRDVAILLAGLPNQVSLLLLDEHISFLRRAFRHSLESIDASEVAYAIRETVHAGGREISESALWKAAEATDGFAFMIQLLGYHMWKQTPDTVEISDEDVERGLHYAYRDMEKMIFETMMRELSDREKEFLTAMAQDEQYSRTSDIAEKLKISTNNATQIKKRLIERCLIRNEGRGKVAFDMPLLREYLRQNGKEDDL